jgi:hypothetical protein
VKFGVGDMRVMPLSKKSHVIYSNFTEGRKRIGGVGVGGTEWIDLAKDRDTRYVACSHGYDLRSHFSFPLDVYYKL